MADQGARDGDDSAVIDGERRRSVAGWSAPVARRRGRKRVLGATLAISTLAAAGAWHGTDVVLERRAEQHAADAWADLRRCMLGTALESGENTTTRIRQLTLEATSGDKNMTAKILGVNSRTIYRKLNRKEE